MAILFNFSLLTKHLRNIFKYYLSKFFRWSLEYSDYCHHLYSYIHNVSADASFNPLQIFLVELGSLHRTLNWTLGLNKRFHLKFWVGSWFQQEIPEEHWKMHQPKCEENNKDENNSLHILNLLKNDNNCKVDWLVVCLCFMVDQPL